jgi:hypothetical protein
MQSARLHHAAAPAEPRLIGVGVIKCKDVETSGNCKIQMLRLFLSSVRLVPITSVLISRESKTFSALVEG